MPNGDGLGIPAVQDLGFDESIEFFFNDPNIPDDEEFVTATGVVDRPVIDPYTRPLTVAPYTTKPETCGDRCDREEKQAKVHCDAVRKRVAQWLKDSGCPSSLKPRKGRKRKCK